MVNGCGLGVGPAVLGVGWLRRRMRMNAAMARIIAAPVAVVIQIRVLVLELLPALVVAPISLDGLVVLVVWVGFAVVVGVLFVQVGW